MSKPAAERRLDDSEALASMQGMRTSARKLNLVARTIRGKTAASALAELTFSSRRIANEVKKVLQAAIANAENNHQLDVDRTLCQGGYGRSGFCSQALPYPRPRPLGAG